MSIKSETARYLGYKSSKPDEKVERLIDEVIGELSEKAQKRSVYRVFDVEACEEKVKIGEIEFKSRQLAKLLSGSKRAALVAATLGSVPDRMITKAALTDIAAAAVVQAAAAAILEDYLDGVEKTISESEGLYTIPRFSPGYGDLTTESQAMLIAAVEADKRIGVTLTDSLMLVPTKSVTAIIGLSEKEHCPTGKCKNCTNKDCEYKK